MSRGMVEVGKRKMQSLPSSYSAPCNSWQGQWMDVAVDAVFITTSITRGACVRRRVNSKR